MKEEIKSKVNIKKEGEYYTIECDEKKIAVTEEELNQIILYSQAILKNRD